MCAVKRRVRHPGRWSREREQLMSMALAFVDAGILTIDQITGAMPRHRDRLFVEEVVKRQAEGATLKEASIAAYKSAHPRQSHYSDQTAYKKALDKLDRPDVNVAAQEILRAANMPVSRLMEIFTAHIEGIEYTDAAGNKIKEKPNYQAAKDALSLILPKAPTKFEGQVAIGVGMMGTGVPEFAARVLPEKRVKALKGESDET